MYVHEEEIEDGDVIQGILIVEDAYEEQAVCINVCVLTSLHCHMISNITWINFYGCVELFQISSSEKVNSILLPCQIFQQ